MNMELAERVRSIYKTAGADGMLVTNRANIRYLSGYTNDTGCLLILEDRRFLLTDFRFLFQARREVKDFEVLDIGTKGYAKLLGELISATSIERLAFEKDDVTFGEYSDYAKHSKARLVPVGNVLSVLRQRKREDELAKIRRAESIGDRAFTEILNELRPGVSELEIAAKLSYFMQMHGAEGMSFPPIVASGVNSSMPHAMPTEKRLAHGDFVTMDFGCVYKGYCSDMTRTVVIGRATEKQREIYNTVLHAQTETLQSIRAGMTGRDIDAIARTIIDAAGYEGCFGHSLGHSLGLEVHEMPTAGPKSTQVFEDGMLVTVEPGIYVQDYGGVRIEDLVVIREDGCENLTMSAKHLIEI